MELWVMMEHPTWADWHQGCGYLLGGFYTDIESCCRALKDDVLISSKVVSIEYANNGEKALLSTEDGHLFGAFKDRIPMREDMPIFDRYSS